MASLKILEQCKVTPPSTTQQFSVPLTFFDLIWLRFHPVERVFFYTLPDSQSHPSFFFNKLVPKLKTSLSLTLQHFHLLAGKIIWPSDSPKPIIKFHPEDDDGVSLILAQYDDRDDATFNQILKHNSPREAIESRSFVPQLESSDSFASVISIQVTLFPKSGFCIGISTHHAVLDGKSSTMFMKAWASICKSNEKTPSLLPELEPFFNREVIKDPNGLDSVLINNWNEISSKFDPNHSSSNKSSMKIMSTESQETLKDSVRATFELTRGDLDNINKNVLSKWNTVEGIEESPKPKKLSTFVLTCAYVSTCIAKATQKAETDKKHKFAFGLVVDCRARLEPPIPENYFGNCVTGHLAVDDLEGFIIEDGFVNISKKIYGKIKMLDKEALDGVETLMSKFMALMHEGVKPIGVAGSTRFGVYETDFGWGRPAKAEITSIDRSFTIGMTESRNKNGGVEVGLVLNKNIMDLFHTLFHSGLCFDSD